MRSRVRIAAVLTATLFTVTLAGYRATHAATDAIIHRSLLTHATAPAVDEEPAVDLFGNEVTEAVATYKFDLAGTVYEEHSPQTEVPRLGSPKS